MSALTTYSRMIKLSHSIFAMPFALASGLLATREVDVSIGQWAAIVACMVFARSSAMGFNRVVDRDIDGRNPRTANREIPSGEISLGAAWAFTLGSAAAFVACAATLGTTTLTLSPIALAVIWGYSLTKRFTWLCHAVLGLALGLAPTAVWIALTDSYAWTPAVLSLAVATWVAGFDILYACQDASFDREAGLSSIPARFGLQGAMWISGALHIGTVALLAALPALIPLGWPYFAGVALITAVLAWEHSIVKPDDLSRLDKAFFDLNGYISLAFLASVWMAS
jgi:4-hydroxybenzoate polyprenyltransferase